MQCWRKVRANKTKLSIKYLNFIMRHGTMITLFLLSQSHFFLSSSGSRGEEDEAKMQIRCEGMTLVLPYRDDILKADKCSHHSRQSCSSSATTGSGITKYDSYFHVYQSIAQACIVIMSQALLYYSTARLQVFIIMNIRVSGL